MPERRVYGVGRCVPGRFEDLKLTPLVSDETESGELCRGIPYQLGSEVLPFHTAQLLSETHDAISLLGVDEHWPAQHESVDNTSWNKTRIYDVATQSTITFQVQPRQSDADCSESVFAGDGRLLRASDKTLALISLVVAATDFSSHVGRPLHQSSPTLTSPQVW